MPEFVRVKLPNGAEASVSASFAKSRGFKTLDKPATKNGLALRDKPKASVPKPAPKQPDPDVEDAPADQ